MKHNTAANAQVGLSYFFMTGFFIAAFLEGIGIVKTSITNELKDGVMLVMSFWFMRPRQTTVDDPPALTPGTTSIDVPAPSAAAKYTVTTTTSPATPTTTTPEKPV